MSFQLCKLECICSEKASEIWGSGFQKREGNPSAVFAPSESIVSRIWKCYTLQELCQLTEILLLPIWLIWEKQMGNVELSENCCHMITAFIINTEIKGNWFESF